MVHLSRIVMASARNGRARLGGNIGYNVHTGKDGRSGQDGRVAPPSTKGCAVVDGYGSVTPAVADSASQARNSLMVLRASRRAATSAALGSPLRIASTNAG